jgi:hypothetical protein
MKKKKLKSFNMHIINLNKNYQFIEEKKLIYK